MAYYTVYWPHDWLDELRRRWCQKKRETGCRMVCKSGFREWLMNCREEAAKSPRIADV